MTFIIFTGIAIGVCIALYGWGLLFYRLINYPVRNWVLTVTVGLGAVIFFGGILNLLRCAYGWAFDGLLIAGIVLAGRYYKFGPALPHNKNGWIYLIVLGILIAVIMHFPVETQLPPKVFNYGDDFEKYFAHPVRMLQTGTLFGSPLSALGLQTFGGQAVLHGIVLNHFSIPYINGVDAVFGLLLCLLLSVSVFPPRLVFLPMAAINLLIVFFINPQYVNVSALYIAVVFMMASILLFSDTNGDKNERGEDLPSSALIGLIYAALVALKSIFVLFPILHLGFLMMALGISGVSVRRLFRWAVLTVCSTFLFLLPWILLHLPHYILWSFPQTTQSAITGSQQEHLNLLSSRPLFYGGSFANYTFLGRTAVLPILALVLWKHKEYFSGCTALAGPAASGVTVVAVYLILVIIFGRFDGYATCLRHAIPFLIAGAPIMLSVVYFRAVKDKSFGFKLIFSVVALLLGTFVIISFSASLMKRIRQGYESGSILAFSELATNPEYIRYSEKVIHGDTRLRLIAAQEQVPAGQAVVVWVSTPFYLDYKRNVIFDADQAGIACPWAYLPDVDYFILRVETHLYGTSFGYERYVAEKCIEFLKSIRQIKENADVLYDDGEIVVFKKHRK